MKFVTIFIGIFLMSCGSVQSFYDDSDSFRYPVPNWRLFDCLINNFVETQLQEGEYVVEAHPETGYYLVYSSKNPDKLDLRWGQIIKVYYDEISTNPL